MARTMLPDWSVDEWKQRVIGTSCRIVCLLDDTRVVKFGCPKNKWTGLQNKIEAQTWKKIADTDAAPFFAATLYSAPNGSFNIQERADGDVGFHESRTVENTPEYAKTEQKLGLSDGGAHQFGYHSVTGRPVVRDYGANSKLWAAPEDEDDPYCHECMWCMLNALDVYD